MKSFMIPYLKLCDLPSDIVGYDIIVNIIVNIMVIIMADIIDLPMISEFTDIIVAALGYHSFTAIMSYMILSMILIMI